MKTVRYGDWEIEVDIEKTKLYYESYNIQISQANRNFAEYCKNLSDEERAFFDSFGIDPFCCEVQNLGLTKNGEYPSYGFYFVCGKYLKYPPELVMPVEELIANNFVDERPDPRIDVGVFRFDFQCEDYMFKNIPEDMPEGYICIRFMCEHMKWLLKERCETRMYEPPKPWEIHKRIRDKIRSAKFQVEILEGRKQEFNEAFKQLGISAVPMTVRELKKYKNDWVNAFAPEGADMEDIKDMCISAGYLWHIFSFEALDCQEVQIASEMYDAQEKQSCVLLSNIDPLGYRLENAEKLDAEALNQFIDVTVTASDFSWTYSKTHEYDLGPYFYKQDENIAKND